MRELLIELGQTPISLAMATSAWIVPTFQSVHIISLAVLFTSVLITGLRVLGLVWAGQSVRQTAARFAPWAWIALASLALSGIVLILAEPIRELMAISFWLKMILLVIAITISVRFLRTVQRDERFAVPDALPDRQMRRTPS
jgi:magnesium-transporting ATPase (P-type)